MTSRALRAIVGARLRAERRTLVLASASAAIVGYFATPTLAGPLFFCSTIGIAIALFQGPGRHPYLDTSERSAPLFGRELARAKALAPAIGAAIATCVYWIAQAASGVPVHALTIALSLAVALTATLIALNSVLVAVITVLIAFGLAKSGGADGAATALLLCAIAGFFALRQYGESLR